MENQALEKTNKINEVVESFNLKEKSKDPVFATQVLRNALVGLHPTIADLSKIPAETVGDFISSATYRTHPLSLANSPMVEMFFEGFDKMDKQKRDDVIKEIVDAANSREINFRI